jgi:hypothetical protein
VRFSRHAKNRMGLYKILFSEVELAAAYPIRKEVDEDGNPRLTGLGAGNRAIIVVLAKDDPDFVITTFPDD